MMHQVSDQHITSKRTMNATTWEDMCATSNEGVYGIEDYHGIDIGILRVVRLWFVPIVPEISIVLQPEGKGIALGLSVCRTKEVLVALYLCKKLNPSIFRPCKYFFSFQDKRKVMY